MLKVGLTGGMASGKSTVAAIFAEAGAQIINADIVAHRALTVNSRCYKLLCRKFGREILTENKIDRKKLAARAFRSANAQRRLSEIVQPWTWDAIQRQLRKIEKNNPQEIVIIEAGLLFEAGWDDLVDATVLVRASRTQQLARAVGARPMTPAEVRQRLRFQYPFARICKKADFIIDNRETPAALRKSTLAVWRRLQYFRRHALQSENIPHTNLNK